MSTSTLRSTAAGSFDLESARKLHPQVSIRPERFGALLYHFGTRRLSFVKNPMLLDVLQRLDSSASAAQACASAGVSGEQLPTYQVALQTLARSHMIQERP